MGEIMRRKAIFFVFGILASFNICLSAASWADSLERPYRIGVIIPLSGQVASLGNYVRRGLDLAHAGLPETKRKRIELVYEDDQFNPSKTVTAYRKLSGGKGIDAAFTIGSPPANALGPIIEKEGKILFAIGASDPTIALGKEYSFIHWVTPPVLGQALAEEIQRRDFQRIAILAAEVTGAIADLEGAVGALKELGLKDRVVYQETFPKEQTDYRTTIAKLRQQKTDAVVIVFFAGALSSFAKQFEASKISAELIGMETFEDESEVRAAGGSLLGRWYVNASDPADWFVSQYKNRYHEHPGWASANGFDSVRLFADAVSAVGNDNRQICDFLRKVKNYKGAAGRYSSSGDNRFTLPAALKIVTAKGFERLNKQ
jgi:branched-chain amino acid transport system substrate-binding protein